MCVREVIFIRATLLTIWLIAIAVYIVLPILEFVFPFCNIIYQRSYSHNIVNNTNPGYASAASRAANFMVCWIHYLHRRQ